MKHLQCSPVSGMHECTFVAKGKTDEEVKEVIKAHGMETHPEMMENASEEQMAEMSRKMDENITEGE